MLNDGWSPQLKLSEVLLMVNQILKEPNPENPLEPEIANQYKADRNAFNKQAKEWTKKYAAPPFHPAVKTQPPCLHLFVRCAIVAWAIWPSEICWQDCSFSPSFLQFLYIHQVCRR